MRFITLGLSLAVALAIGWWGTVYYADPYIPINKVVVERYSSTDSAFSRPIERGTVRQSSDSQRRALEITCQFRLNNPEALPANTNQYPNLFQTSGGNEGVRLEFVIPREGRAAWALIFANQQGEGITVITLEPFPSIDEWHTIEIKVKAERVLVRLDGSLISNKVWAGLDYAMDEVVVGSGISLTRPFSGEIRHFVLSTSQRIPSLDPLLQTLSNLMLVGVGMTFLGCLFYQLWVPGDKWLRPHRVDVGSSTGGTWGKLRLLLVIVAVGHLIAGIYYYWNAVYLGKPYPYNSYLSYPPARFTDYDNMILMCRNLNPYHDHSRSGYPPLANILFYLFSPFSMGFGFFLYLIPPACFLVWAGRRLLSSLSKLQQLLTIVFILIFSYPFVFTLDRGNLEFYIMIALGAFFLFYNAKAGWQRELACLGLAAGISLKIYPLLLLLLPLKDRRHLDCLKILLMAEVLTLGAALTFVGGAQVALLDFRDMLSETDQLLKNQLQYAHANSGIFYGMVIVFKKLGLETLLQWCYRYYWLVALALMAGYSLVILRAKLSFWASAVCVVALFCLIPSLSNDYRTIQLLLPLLLFATERTPLSRGFTLITVLLGLLLVPRNYWILFPDVNPRDVGIGSIITPVVLFVLLNAILYLEQFGRPETGVPGRYGTGSSLATV